MRKRDKVCICLGIIVGLVCAITFQYITKIDNYALAVLVGTGWGVIGFGIVFMGSVLIDFIIEFWRNKK